MVCKSGSGSNKLWNNGDFNYDGTTNTADFTLMAQNFGLVLTAPPVPGALVPEPAMALVALSLFLTNQGRSKRRQSQGSRKRESVV